jgi:hypothetical protein
MWNVGSLKAGFTSLMDFIVDQYTVTSCGLPGKILLFPVKASVMCSVFAPVFGTYLSKYLKCRRKLREWIFVAYLDKDEF